MSPAQSGATALVPPTTMLDPSTSTLYPEFGSASAHTSGTPRPPLGFAGAGTCAVDCHDGSAKTSPPPESLQAVSEEIAVPDAFRVVPPQPSACGLDAGKSACEEPSLCPSLEPLSPDATHTVTPIAAAAAQA